MADCRSTAGIHLIVERGPPGEECWFPFVHMLSLDLCERPGKAKTATQSSPAVENGDTVGNAPAVGKASWLKAVRRVTTRPMATPVDGNAPNAAALLAEKRRPWRISTRRLILLAAIVLGVRIFVGEASVVPTASMEGTILVGDHLFMDKLLYGPEIPLVHWRLPALRSIHRGDIIVFRYPKDPSETFLKRVAAMGGDGWRFAAACFM